uniref:Uncharacterized protein n=1 Tax=Anguilla anguilla TaxID=7936 RepID=A0A0E9TEX0_ANGAN
MAQMLSLPLCKLLFTNANNNIKK